MPLSLKAPRKGKSPNWSIRGTYLGIKVDKTCGTDKPSIARAQLRKLERQIERGEYPKTAPVSEGVGEPTFLDAALKYLEARKRPRYVKRLGEYFGDTPLSAINQAAVERAAVILFPHAGAATRNTCVFTPVSAILHHAGIDIRLRRPKGAKGRVVTDYLVPDDASAIISAAETFDGELALLLRFLLYTGCRLGEALALRWEDVDLNGAFARIRHSKNGEPRGMKLREDLRDAMRTHPMREHDPRIFRFHQGGWLKSLLLRAKLQACGLNPPARTLGKRRHIPAHHLSWVNFHTFRHTFATWFRRYGGADVQGLVATGNWRDPRSAARYAHVVPREEWERVEKLPSIADGIDVERIKANG